MCGDAICHPLYREERGLSSVWRIRSLFRTEKESVRAMQSAQLRQIVADHKASDTLDLYYIITILVLYKHTIPCTELQYVIL